MHIARLFIILAAALLPTSAPAADVAELIKQADALDKQFKNKDALAICQEAEKLAPKDAEVLRRIAKQYAEIVLDETSTAQKKALADKALDYAKQAVAANPKNALAELALAVCYGRAATLADSKTKIAYSKLIKEHADKSLALDPKNDLTYFVLGSWSYEMANLGTMLRAVASVVYDSLPTATNEDAVRYLEKAVSLNPQRVSNHATLGRAYAALGQKDKARQSLTRALALPNTDKADDLVKTKTRDELAKL